jgi:hypothetical protein
MNLKLNRRQITEFAIAAGVLSASQSARAFAFSIFGAQVDTDKTSRRSDMPDPQTQYPPLSPDDLNRTLTSANPNHKGKLSHIGLVGDTYTGKHGLGLCKIANSLTDVGFVQVGFSEAFGC